MRRGSGRREANASPRNSSTYVRDRQRAIRVLSALLEQVSELLYGSILLEREYPELAEGFAGMAEDTSAQIRLLGRWMLRNGIDPPLRSLFRGNGCACGRSGSSAESAEALTRSLLRRSEEILAESEAVFSGSTDESFAEVQRAQTERLRRILS